MTKNAFHSVSGLVAWRYQFKDFIKMHFDEKSSKINFDGMWQKSRHKHSNVMSPNASTMHQLVS